MGQIHSRELEVHGCREKHMPFLGCRVFNFLLFLNYFFTVGGNVGNKESIGVPEKRLGCREKRPHTHQM